METHFNSKVYDADDNTVKTEDKHRADGNEEDKAETDDIKTATEVDYAIDGKEIHNVIENDME